MQPIVNRDDMGLANSCDISLPSVLQVVSLTGQAPWFSQSRPRCVFCFSPCLGVHVHIPSLILSIFCEQSEAILFKANVLHCNLTRPTIDLIKELKTLELIKVKR